MRYFFLLLLLFFLCTSGRAQNFTITASIGLAADYCNPVISNPNTDCINVPLASNTLTYLPGEDGDIIITYRLTNNSAGTITQVLITDSDRGVIVPVSNVSIAPGQTIRANRIYAAETLPRRVTPTVTASVSNATGNSSTVTGQYTLDVVAPEIEVLNFGVGQLEGDCTPGGPGPQCYYVDGMTDITVSGGETIAIYVRWTNTGLSTIDSLTGTSTLPVVDGAFILRPQDLAPGSNSFQVDYLLVPDAAGTYNESVTIVAQDYAGNKVTTVLPFTITVAAPALEFPNFGVGQLEGDCAPGGLGPQCYYVDGMTDITVSGAETIAIYVRWRNIGPGVIDSVRGSSTLPVSDGEFFNRPQDLAVGSNTFHVDYLIVPDAVGTYNESITIVAQDYGGNTTTYVLPFTITVAPPALEFPNFGVGQLEGDCTPGGLGPQCYYVDGMTDITVSGAETIAIYVRWRNIGPGVIDSVRGSSTLPVFDGEFFNRPQDLAVGATTFHVDYLIVPDAVGTYNESITIVAQDYGGNTTTYVLPFTITVTPPALEFPNFGVGQLEGDCTPGGLGPQCYYVDGTTSVSLGAGETFAIYVRWRNIGPGVIDSTRGSSTLPVADGQLINRPQDLEVGANTFQVDYLIAPENPGTYNESVTVVAKDYGGNETTYNLPFTVIVNCALGDFVPPVAVCQDRTITIDEDETRVIPATQLDGGSSDNCGGLAGATLDVNTFTCAEIGVNPVVLTVFDEAGLTESCSATITVEVRESIFTGENNQCTTAQQQLTMGQGWQDLRTPAGKLVAQVDIGNNTNIGGVRANVFRTPNLTEEANGQPYLSKRANLQVLNQAGNPVQPNNNPVYVRLFYTDEEIAALLASSPGSDLNTITLVKTSGTDCGTGYTGTNATAMNTTVVSYGCVGDDTYLEFFTGTFSTFYLFATSTVLPVELTTFEARAIEKQRVQLNWATASETDNDYFQVEHSSDGRAFRVLGAVAGAGDSFTEQGYTYRHETPVAGPNYYRLRQVDFDGTEALSEVREVTITSQASLVLYPNPTVEELYVKGYAGGPVRVINQRGQVVLERKLAEFAPLDVRVLPAGMYLLQAGNTALRWVKR